jgi:hypothetical protein
MNSATGSVHEIMLKMRMVALSWTAGDQEMADDLVARALKNALDAISDTNRVDIEDWLMDLLRQKHEEAMVQGFHSAAGRERH